MKKTIVLIAVVAVVAVTFFLKPDSTAPTPTPDPATVRTTAEGDVVGFTTQTGAHAWLGIPFAAPPTGDLRWRAPRPALARSEPLSALQSGAPCVQIGGPLGGVSEDQYGEIVGSEDCLFLNIWAPASAPAEGLPVMVWIHGGGNTIGQAADYDGQYLATQENVVVVAVNYRLGIFGWLTHPKLHEGGSDPLDASGNFGTLDNIAALRWVQDNIAAFGGDAANVTVFGESAGGRNVLALLTSPEAAGLFQRAISQSGMALGVTVEEAIAHPDEGGDANGSTALLARWLVAAGHATSENEARTMLASPGGNLSEMLRALDSRSMMAGFPDALGGMFQAPQLFEDGIVLPAMPLFQAFATPGAINDVPVMLGTNRDEMKLFLAQSPRYSKRNFGLFIEQINVGDFELESAYRSRYWKALGVDELARAMNATGKTDVYAYRFDWDEGADTIFADMSSLLGAAHGLEIPFVFGDFSDFFGNTLIFDDDNAASRLPLSKAMMRYWANFAADGSPGGDGNALAAWTPWSQGGGQFMVLDSADDGGVRMSDDSESVMALLAELTAETGFSDDATLCRIYAVNNYGTPWWNEQAYQGLGKSGCAAYPADKQPRF